MGGFRLPEVGIFALYPSSERVPLKVALSGADHAWSYVFLASDRARGITGDVVHPDGGIAVKR